MSDLPQNLEDWLNLHNMIPKASARAQFVEMHEQIEQLQAQVKQLEKDKADMFWNEDGDMSFDTLEELAQYHCDGEDITMKCRRAISLPDKEYSFKYDEENNEYNINPVTPPTEGE